MIVKKQSETTVFFLLSAVKQIEKRPVAPGLLSTTAEDDAMGLNLWTFYRNVLGMIPFLDMF